MKSTLFLTLCVVVYVSILVSLIVKLRDISRNPEKYDVIPGRDKYRKSIWYEQSYERYGKHYHANLIVGIPCLMGFPVLYILVGMLIQKYLLIPIGAVFLRSYQLFVGAIACIFFLVFFVSWIAFHSKAPVMIASSFYAYSHMKRCVAWKKLTISMLVVCVLCLPIMMLCVNAYSYANHEKIVTHQFLSLEESVISYDTIVSAETSYTSNEKQTQFYFVYDLILQDGTRINIMEYGRNGTKYLHTMIQQRDIPITHGQIDAVTYEYMKEVCKESTMEQVDQYFVIVP